MRRFRRSCILLTAALLFPLSALAGPDQLLETRYATVHYSQEQDIADLFWRITGRRLDPVETRGLASNRVDEIVERVETLLEMYPSPFRVAIRIEPKYLSGPLSCYTNSTRRITVYLDRITDGMLAHEIAHAVICAYFPTPPPERAQEVLARYVDQHLWE